ncbi:cytochrome C oxidase subunit IV family protein [Streptomyces sp. NPDC051776]|uniref:cytochrome C oxidase subunit IV family protein n=1 Tax=Streptomyces sp. NPDC051776 TaxID=3155414 RepID=UPI00341E2759
MTQSSASLRTNVLAAAVVWILLVGSALISGLETTPSMSVALTTGIVCLAALKVVLVISVFMEVHRSPLWLKALCGVWTAVVFSVIFLLNVN